MNIMKIPNDCANLNQQFYIICEKDAFSLFYHLCFCGYVLVILTTILLHLEAYNIEQANGLRVKLRTYRTFLNIGGIFYIESLLRFLVPIYNDAADPLNPVSYTCRQSFPQFNCYDEKRTSFQRARLVSETNPANPGYASVSAIKSDYPSIHK